MVEAGSLTQVDIFQGLSMEHLEQIAAMGQEQVHQQGAVIFRENSAGDCMYIVLDGEVEILVDPRILGEEVSPEIEPEPVTIIRRGQSFGEIALVDQGVRSASAVCHSPTVHLLSIPQEEFLQLCQQDLALGYQVMFNVAVDLASRIRTTDLLLRGRLLTSSADR